ncbi:hypothetical protein ACVWWG_001768 [Bradyrhizobium sp. LB7.2]
MTTKILALTDALGNLVRFVLLPGQRFDTVGVPPLIEGLAFNALIADKAFDSNAIQTLPPIGKQKRYSPQLLTYIQALEIDPPAGRPPIDWKLVTNLPVGNFAIAIEKLEWCALRWKAEVFHKVMKSGCRAEEARLETAERLTKFLALIAMVSWRIFFLTMSARAKPEAAPETVLTPTEIATLDAIDGARAKPRILRKTLATYLLQIAMLGGYLARKHDPPPGNMVVWRGLTRLNDIAFGLSIRARPRCGQIESR